MSMFTQLLEYTYNNMVRKQQSITSLFPTFYKRVRDVKDAGRVTLVSQYPDVWQFKVPSSGSKGDYTVYLRFKNIEEMLSQFVPNVKLWNVEKTDVDYNKLGPEVINKVDMEFDCSCPADTYWGAEYIKTQKGAQFGHQEYRPPKVRNPKQYGAVCKHQQALLDKLPSYNFTFNGFLKKFYSKEVKEIFDQALKVVGGIKKIAAELKPVEKPAEQPQRFGRGGRVIEEPPTEVESEPKIEKLAPEIVSAIDAIPEDMSKMMQGELQKTLKKYNIKPEDYLKYLEEQK